MCAIYGFLNYGKRIHPRLLARLLRELSIAAECRGTDATGISYIKDGGIVTYKKAKPAHKLNLYFPRDTTAVIGHNRMATQGSEKLNYNNHPFTGQCGTDTFALAHNGVLYNDTELRTQYQLPQTMIETDSYIAVQLLERSGAVNAETIAEMAELVRGSFVFTILRDDNTIFLVRGDNPLTLYHYPTLGLYVYASTKAILDKALVASGFHGDAVEIPVHEGEIVEIHPDGTMQTTDFILHEEMYRHHYGYSWYNNATVEEDELMFVCSCFGMKREDVKLLLRCGYSACEIEDMLMDDDWLAETLAEAKAMLGEEVVP